MTVLEALYFGPNLPFLILLGLAVIFSFLQIFGGLLDHDHDIGHDGLAHDFMDWLDFGGVPITFPLITLLVGLGFGGMLINALVVTYLGRYAGWYLIPVGLLALVLGSIMALCVAYFISRNIDLRAPRPFSPEDLLNKPATVAGPWITKTHGEVRVKNNDGIDLIVHARIDEVEPLRYGTPVVLYEYDSEKKTYLATANRSEVDDDFTSKGERT